MNKPTNQQVAAAELLGESDNIVVLTFAPGQYGLPDDGQFRVVRLTKNADGTIPGLRECIDRVYSEYASQNG